MKRFWKFVPCLTRLFLLPPTMIFALIATRYITHPVKAAAAQGILLDSPLGVTIARVGFGAFPLGCAIFTFSCPVSTRRLLTGLAFVGNMMGLVLGVRILGILVDGTARENMRLVGAEILLLVIMVIGVFLELARRREQLKISQNVGTSRA